MKDQKNPWFSDDKGRKLDKTTLLSLYTRYHEHMGNSLNRHFNVRNYYTALLSVLSGLYMVRIIQLAIANMKVTNWSILHCVLLTLPLIISALSILAIFSATRYYRTFLRMIVLIAKIENMLGIDSQVKSEEKCSDNLIWEKDERFIIQSYWDSRIAFKKSKEFIDEKKYGGDNKWTCATFAIFLVIGIVFLFLNILWALNVLEWF